MRRALGAAFLFFVCVAPLAAEISDAQKTAVHAKKHRTKILTPPVRTRLSGEEEQNARTLPKTEPLKQELTIPTLPASLPLVDTTPPSMLMILAITAGAILGLILHFFAAFWLLRWVGPQRYALEGGVSYAPMPMVQPQMAMFQPPTGGGSLAMNSELAMWNDGPKKPSQEETEHAVLMHLFQENMDLQNQLGSLEPKPVVDKDSPFALDMNDI